MRYAVLASGSKGNSIYVESENTKILIDAGISRKAIKDALMGLGVLLEDISGLCITHDHLDHVSGVRVLSNRHNMPLYATLGTSDVVDLDHSFNWNIFESGSVFNIGDMTIESFRTPHDAADPVGYVISDGKSRLGIATDLGELRENALYTLQNCDALVFEFNHDVDMLWESERPWDLKRRISSNVGHLSNKQAAEGLARLASSRLKNVFLAHISSECNTCDTARRLASRTLELCGLKDSVSIYTPDLNCCEMISF